MADGRVDWPRSSAFDRFEAIEPIAVREDAVDLAGGAVHRDQPRVALGAQIREERADGRPRRDLDGGPIATLRHEATEVAVHVNVHAHDVAARTLGMTSRWNRSMVVSMRPSTDSG